MYDQGNIECNCAGFIIPTIDLPNVLDDHEDGDWNAEIADFLAAGMAPSRNPAGDHGTV
jgi:hypothetical protein